jgi:RHS repeat-associated protein
MPEERQKTPVGSKAQGGQYPSIASNENPAKSKSNLIETPSISLPKGGGAIKSIDEKFQVNAANGTASFSIPFPVSQARGFVPSLGLSYNSGGGNSPFGLGWNLEAPSIQRKTDKKLPEYRDEEDSDTFMYSGAEDLVPFLDNNGKSVDPADGSTKRYRPRVEGGFSKIEKINDAGNVYWKVTTKDNIVSIFGRSTSARIADPADLTRIFQWFLEFSYDDKGHCILYQYKEEDRQNVPGSTFEKNRENGISPVANTFLHSILYCNKKPWYIEDKVAEPSEADYLLSVVFDYGEWNKTEDAWSSVAAEDDPLRKWVHMSKRRSGWTVRKDAYSEFRAGFDVRTYRLCQRILQFHHFDELTPKPCLVRSMDFTYDRLPDEPRREDLLYANDRPFLTYLRGITQCGYVWDENKGQYAQKSMPPLTFDYQQAPIFEANYDPKVERLTRENLVNLPIGIDDKVYSWTDLYSEGISGVLTEQGGEWFYKENMGHGEFTRAQLVLPKPSFSGLSSGAVSLQDLQGNGVKQLVTNSGVTKGFFELSPESLPGEPAEWRPFVPFEQFPTVNFGAPNAKLLDLNGDGMADLLITEQDIFTWYPGQGKTGYDEARQVLKPIDEERGPSIVFADSTQSIVLADMSGDGLTDIVRIRNRDVCYWPNMGYGRFGAKVTMENAPLFDAPELFNPRYIKLADIDGTGTTDIIYLAHNEFKVWFNHSGNTWSDPTLILNTFPELDSESDLSVIDFLGHGTSCIVWSSPLPQFANSPLRYIDLCGGKKPHVMRQYRNNLGKEITVEYKSSTEYYLADKKEHNRWATKLPFPVQCVSKVVVQDHISQTRFVNEYKYRHGYYDHVEREFRGFAYVEQTDTEAFKDYKIGTPAGGPMSTEPEFFQPAVITKSWFHTGAFFDGERVLHQLEKEYWPRPLLKNDGQDDPDLLNAAQAWKLLEPELSKNWTTDEWREALRALKGLPLRQEVYSDEGPDEKKSHPYSVAQHNYELRRLQARKNQRYAVFYPHEKETLTAHYERNPADPRMAHSANLVIDEYGNVLESASVVYGRKKPDAALSTAADQEQQTKIHITYTEGRVTNKIDDAANYRLPVGYETRTWELLAKPSKELFTADELQTAFQTATEADYSKQAKAGEKRKIEHARTLFLSDDLNHLLPLGTIESRALAGEAYALAYTAEMIGALYDTRVSEGFLRNDGRYLRSEGDGNYWIASGRAYPYPDLQANPNLTAVLPATAADLAYARQHFYMPVVFQDSFGSLTKVFYDPYHLFMEKAVDALGNETAVEGFNYRTLAPYLLRDPNDNRSGVRFDELGLVTSTFVMGKATEQLGDLLDTATTEASPNDEPTTKLSYEFCYYLQYLEEKATPPPAKTKARPNRVKTEVREKHHFKTPEPPPTGLLATISGFFSSPAPTGGEVETNIVWQTAYSYSDGSGHEVLKKIQAEKGDMPERDANGILTGDIDKTKTKPRWVGNGRTILNNKGNPVKQYEPYFDSTEAYNDEAELVQLGFTPLLYYDAVGRMIKTVKPNGTFSKVAFDAWMQKTWDDNDTVKDSDWYLDRISGQKGLAEREAAVKAAVHYDTPSTVHLDSLGRLYLSIAQNVTQRSTDSAPVTETYLTRSEYDIEGNVRSVTDARGNVVMRWQYDMPGNVCRQTSMDAGERWMLHDAMGKPLRSWDSRDQRFSYTYDELHRPTAMKIEFGDGPVPLNHTFERFEYGETAPNANQKNLRGKAWRHYDTAGMTENVAHDFKGNLLESTRTLLKDYKNVPDWSANPAPGLENETFTSETRYDALNRPEAMTMPDKSLVQPGYNEANLLDSLKVNLKGGNETTVFVQNIDYNAKGQRERIQYGNDTTTGYDYEPETFRLKHLLTTAANGTIILQDLNYTYDPVGNITEIYDNAQKTVFYGGQKIDSKQAYWYDALYRLIEATGREHIGQMDLGRQDDNWDDNWAKQALQANSPIQLRDYRQQYTYDAVGNFLKTQHIAGQGSWTRQYTNRTDNNQLLYTSIGGRTHALSYNAHGSMATMPHLRQIDWNFKEEMTHADLVGGGQAYYVYDSGGQRTRKVIERIDGTIEERIYLGTYEVYRERRGTRLILRRETLHIMDDKQRVAMVETRTQGNDGSPKQLQRYQYSNHLGTACLELDKDGVIISYEEFHPYGTTAYQAVNALLRAAAKRYRFTGMERDEETGMEYHSARYYVGWLGRWTATDPQDVNDGVNIYLYVNDSPILKKDPFGNKGWKDDLSMMEKFALWVDENVGTENMQHAANFAGGLGDTLSMGATAKIRQVGGFDKVEYDSAMYKTGEYSGVAVQSMVSGGGVGAVGKALAKHAVEETKSTVIEMTIEEIVPENYQEVAKIAASAASQIAKQSKSGSSPKSSVTATLAPRKVIEKPKAGKSVQAESRGYYTTGDGDRKHTSYIGEKKHKSAAFNAAKARLKEKSLTDDKLPRYIRGHFEQEKKQRGDNPRYWKNPKGFDAGHIDPDNNLKLRWESSDMNQVRGGKYRR